MTINMKWCPHCQEERPAEEFYVDKARSDGLYPICIEHRRISDKQSRERKRREFLDTLGGECQRCGFSDWRALQIDHVNSNGHLERAENLGQSEYYRRILANPDDYMILCANCNWIKRYENGEAFSGDSGRRLVATERIPYSPRQPFTDDHKANQSKAAQTRWQNPDAREAMAEAKKDGKRVYAEDGSFHYAYPGDLDYGQSRWAKDYDCCTSCGTTAKRHVAKGLCSTCRYKQSQVSPPSPQTDNNTKELKWPSNQ